jgi:hypothetical protein
MARRPTISEVVRSRYWTEQEARVIVTAWQQSGTPLVKFADKRGLKAKRLSRWAARLGVQSEPEVTFHPVRLVASPHQEERAADGIEVVLVNGRRLRLPAGFATADLARALAVLESGPSC